jgi:putative hemolysin
MDEARKSTVNPKTLCCCTVTIRTGFLHAIVLALTVLLQLAADTATVIAQGLPTPSLKFAVASSAGMELAFPTCLPAPPPEVRKPSIHAEVGRYKLRLAETVEDREAACRLRFKVFNIELHEGLKSSYQTGLDTDDFDLFCEHLLVEDKLEANPAKRVVGTYRMQSGTTAERNLGYYSEREFSFAPYEPLRTDVLELGRASIDREHRTPEVLTLLWRGIAQYASDMGLRYMIGCSSLNSKNPAEGWQVYSQLEQYRVSPEFATEPTASYVCPSELEGAHSQLSPSSEDLSLQSTVKVPKLLKTYLAIGARICGAPAWDRDFGTIDFLTLLDLKLISASARNRFLAPLTT